jgi:hypothetical protein
MKKLLNLLVTLILSINSKSQTPPRHIKDLYNKIYTSIAGDNFIQPKLEIINDEKSDFDPNNIAYFSPQENVFRIGVKFLNVTRSFGVDSNNARSYILAHELAHFFKHKHLRELGTGFASSIDKKMKKIKDSINLSVKEFEADQWAYFYSYISGYKINDVAPRLLDTLYKLYKIPSKLEGYPTLKERKSYASSAKVKMQSMCDAFDFANLALIIGNYEMAEIVFTAIHEEGFQSREIKSNLGTAHFLKAIHLIDTSEFKYILPVQIDFKSRLNQNSERGGITDNEEIIEALDKSISYYKSTIVIDTDYKLGYFNLSMALWLKGYILNEPNDDYLFYLSKSKNGNDNNINNIKVFEAIIKLCSKNKIQENEGLTEMKKLAEQNIELAKVNLNYSTATTSKKQLPDWIKNIQNSKLPDNYPKVNTMDSTFKRVSLRCSEIPGNIHAKKWKYVRLSGGNSLITEQFIFSESKSISDNEKNELITLCDALYRYENEVFLKFDKLIVCIESNNKCKFQIIR